MDGKTKAQKNVRTLPEVMQKTLGWNLQSLASESMLQIHGIGLFTDSRETPGYKPCALGSSAGIHPDSSHFCKKVLLAILCLKCILMPGVVPACCLIIPYLFMLVLFPPKVFIPVAEKQL